MGIVRSLVLEDETLEMGPEVRTNMAFLRGDKEIALARPGNIS